MRRIEMAKRSLIVAATLLLSNAIALAQIAGPPGQDSRAPGYGTPHSPRNAEKSERPAAAAKPDVDQPDPATTGRAPETSDKMHPEAEMDSVGTKEMDSVGTKMPPGGEMK
jgi:hypothetical protein